jgi:hypothetical protein
MAGGLPFGFTYIPLPLDRLPPRLRPGDFEGPRSDPFAHGKKVKWSDCEDKILVACVHQYGPNNWATIAQSLPGRTGKQCRERWTNQLDPSLSRENWTPHEDAILLTQQKAFGNVWAKISAQLPGRSSNAVKNRWCWLIRHQAPAPETRWQPAPKPDDAPRPPPGEMAQLFQPEFGIEKADPFWVEQSDSFWI